MDVAEDFVLCSMAQLKTKNHFLQDYIRIMYPCNKASERFMSIKCKIKEIGFNAR